MNIRQGFQVLSLPRRSAVQHQPTTWSRTILLSSVLALGSFLSYLLLPMKASTQQAVIPPAIQRMQAQIALNVPSRFQGKIVSRANLSHEQKAIALTFDDGPWPNTTPSVLDILKENHIKATFFVIGQNLKRFPSIAKQIVVDGNAIGNHTWHHWRGQMDELTAANEIETTSALIYKTTGVKTLLFRPPNGYLYNGLADYARQRKQVVVMWSIDSGDWRNHGISVDKLVNHVLERARPGAIVLMHDGGGNRSLTVQALPQIIQKLTEQGYKFVTVPELLQMQGQPLNARLNS